MSLFVVDASVGIKWFVAEIHGEAAKRLRVPSHELHVPAFFDVEVANIVWKKRRRGELTRAEADAILVELPLLSLVRHLESPLITSAFDLAEQHLRTVYDSLYLALALRENGQLVTADDRFINSLANTAHAATILHVQNVP